MTQTNPEYDWEIIATGFEALKSLNTTFLLSNSALNFAKELIKFSNVNLGKIENKELKLIVVLLIIGIYVLYRLTLMRPNNFYGGSFRMSNSSVGSSGSQLGNMEVTALPVELENGHIKVGNIYFDPSHILGKGCEGTFVYK